MPELSAANLGKPISSKSENTRNRILDAAIDVFAGDGEDSVSIVDIASRAGITSQGIYRYFPNKRELYLAAVEADYNRLLFNVLWALRELPAPFLTGEFWRSIIEEMKGHPLAVNAVVSRDPGVLDRVNMSEGAHLLTTALKSEILKSIEMKFHRQDLDPEVHTSSASYLMLNMSLPLVFAGKYYTPAWFAMAGTQLAAAFYPVPNFQDLAVAEEFQKKMVALGQNETLKNYKFS